MAHTTAFIGCRLVFYYVRYRVFDMVKREYDEGCRRFLISCHLGFNRMSLDACRALRKIHPDVSIEIVFPTQPSAETLTSFNYTQCEGEKITVYPIDKSHYERHADAGDRMMIDESDTLICYVDENDTKSLLYDVLEYAGRHGVKIVNLFSRDDFVYKDLDLSGDCLTGSARKPEKK